MGYLVKLEIFEGPFDLLLNLIEKAEIDIFDIPIAQITEEYLDYLRKMQELDLVVSGDFLVMAATLLQIKAKMLLPAKPQTDEEEPEEDPREELVERLLEYKFYKEIAEILQTKSQQAAGVYPRYFYDQSQHKSPIFTNPIGEADANTLAKLFSQVLQALKESKTVTHIKRRRRSMAETIASIRLTMLKRNQVTFSELLIEKDRYYILMTFLAVLELVHMQEIKAVQEQDFGEIKLILLA
ncbi:MAG: segregation/condensation protein A [Firmicutes bacterium]|nr:segregation/condensation protein A [Bacillota bacterium]